jgi:hypothetical protein
MFGGLGDRRRATSRLRDSVSQQFYELRNEYQAGYGSAIERFLADRDAQLGAFQGLMQQAIGGYATMIDQTRERLMQGYDEARREYAIGRDSTIERIRETTEAQRTRRVAANAFTGLGQTTMGQQAVESIQRAGDIEEGMVREQYAVGLSQIMERRAQSVLGLDETASGTLARMRQDLATGYAGVLGDYARGSAAMLGRSIEGVANFGMARIGATSKLEQQRISMKSGSNLGFGLIGAAAGAFLPGIGNAIGEAVGGVFGEGISKFGSALGDSFGGGENGG